MGWGAVAGGMLVPWAVFHLSSIFTCQLWASLLGCQPWLCLSLAMWPGQYLGALLCPLKKTGQTPGLPQGVPVRSQGVNTSSYGSDKGLARCEHHLDHSRLPKYLLGVWKGHRPWVSHTWLQPCVLGASPFTTEPLISHR